MFGHLVCDQKLVKNLVSKTINNPIVNLLYPKFNTGDGLLDKVERPFLTEPSVGRGCPTTATNGLVGKTFYYGWWFNSINSDPGEI